jgi:hypothetical protein
MGVDEKGIGNIMSGLSLKPETLTKLSQVAIGVVAPIFSPHIAQVLALKSGLSALSKVSGQESILSKLKPNLAKPAELFYSVAHAFTGQKADNPQVALGQIATKINKIQEPLASTGFKVINAIEIAQKPVNEALPTLANYAETVANAFKNQNTRQAQARQKFGFNMPGISSKVS